MGFIIAAFARHNVVRAFRRDTKDVHAALGPLGKSIRRAATDKVKTAIAAVRCPVHGSGASDIRVETQGSKMNFTFTACCDGLKQAISTRLR